MQFLEGVLVEQQVFQMTAFRTQLFGPNDMDTVKKVQSGDKVQPLSAYLEQPAPTVAPLMNFPPFNKELVKTNFLVSRLRLSVRTTSPSLMPGGFGESKSYGSLELLAWFHKDVAQRVDELAFLYTNIRLRQPEEQNDRGPHSSFISAKEIKTVASLVTAQNCSGFGI